MYIVELYDRLYITCLSTFIIFEHEHLIEHVHDTRTCCAQLWRFNAMNWHMLLVFDEHVFVFDSVLVFMFEKPDQTWAFKISRMQVV